LSPADLAGLTLTAPDNMTFTLNVRAMSTEASNGSTATTFAPLAVTVRNTPPTLTRFAAVVGVNGSGEAVRAFPVTFALQTTDPSPLDTFTYQFDWDGDGTFEESSPAGQGRNYTATHVYPALGSFRPAARAV